MTSDETSPGQHLGRVRPFPGLRFARDAAERTFVPPQSWSQSADVGDSGLDPYHLLRLLDPVLGTTGRRDNAGHVAELLDRWTDDGVLVEDPPGMYVYRRGDGEDTVLGVVVAALLRRGETPGLLPHEEVLEPLVRAQARLERVTAAQLEPIVAICSGAAPDAPTLERLVSGVLDTTPLYRIDEDGVRHELWPVLDEAVHRAIDDAASRADLLIADGHHRHAAWTAEAARHERLGRHHPSGLGLTMLVDSRDSGLRLGPVHRVVRGVRIDDAVSSPSVDAVPLADARSAHQFLASGPTGRCVLAGDDRFLAVTPRAGSVPTCSSPEWAVCWLHDVWLAVWGVDGSAVEYVHAADSAVALATARDGIAVLLPSPGLQAVLDAATSGVPLPHKATSFGPKPRVGMVMRRWDAP